MNHYPSFLAHVIGNLYPRGQVLSQEKINLLQYIWILSFRQKNPQNRGLIVHEQIHYLSQSGRSPSVSGGAEVCGVFVEESFFLTSSLSFFIFEGILFFLTPFFSVCGSGPTESTSQSGSGAELLVDALAHIGREEGFLLSSLLMFSVSMLGGEVNSFGYVSGIGAEFSESILSIPLSQSGIFSSSVAKSSFFDPAHVLGRSEF